MSEFSSIHIVMKKSLKSLGEEVYMQYLRHSILFNWKEIVGEVNANHIKPLRIEYKRLFIYVGDSSWQSNVYAYKSTFIKKINDYAGENVIDDIIFGNPLERPKEDENIVLAPPPEVDIAKEIKQIVLTESELEKAIKACDCIEDDDLRATMIKTSISRTRLEKYRRQKGRHDCPNCGTLCPPEEIICDSCARFENEMFERAVMKIFQDVPYATYAEVKNEIKNTMPQMLKKCRPETISSIKTTLVQQIASSLDKEDQKKIQLLVMLYKGAQPKDLSDNLINKALYELRHNLPMKGRLKLEG